VHSGHVEWGHYYAFIFDQSTNKWWRFNDCNVTEETWENVKKESFGSKDTATAAYALIYANEWC
jgi:hypothetical protein